MGVLTRETNARRAVEFGEKILRAATHGSDDDYTDFDIVVSGDESCFAQTQYTTEDGDEFRVEVEYVGRTS